MGYVFSVQLTWHALGRCSRHIQENERELVDRKNKINGGDSHGSASSSGGGGTGDGGTGGEGSGCGGGGSGGEIVVSDDALLSAGALGKSLCRHVIHQVFLS